MKWIPALDGDFKGETPSPRSGHTAVRIRRSHVVVFGGLIDKKFMQELTVLDIDNNVWFKPECSGSGSDGVPGPCARAFHVAVAMDCNMFVFGGRAGRRRLGDFWMLDTDSWQWCELTGFGELPAPRDFAAGASVGNGKLVICGGWDGTKWLNDVYVLDTMTLEWRQLVVTGPTPPPRCGHTATIVEKRLLVFGGRGVGGHILGDLWALKGLFDGEREPPAWTQLKLSGPSPAPRCGHSTTSGGPQLLFFGGHGTAGWLSRYDVYHDDCVVLDRASVEWKRLAIVSTDNPAPRAYHSLTKVGLRFLLVGGYDGKATFGDIWWLVSEGDVLYQRVQDSPQPQPQTPPRTGSTTPEPAVPVEVPTSEGGRLLSPLNMFRLRLGLPVRPPLRDPIADGATDTELILLAKSILPAPINDGQPLLEAVRKHWATCNGRSITFKELGPLLRDYHRLIALFQRKGPLLASSGLDGEGPRVQMHRFYHIVDAKQLRLDDIPSLVAEYKQLVDLYHARNANHEDVHSTFLSDATPEAPQVARDDGFY